MNSYENKNEYKILNASQKNFNMSNRYPRYPIANNPQIPMRNTNYKDWLNECEGTNNECHSLISPSNIESVMQISLELGFALIGALGGPIGSIISAIGGPVVSLLWGEFGNQWDASRDMVEELINQTLDANTRNQAAAKLDSLKNIFDLYITRLKTWEKTRDADDLRELTSQFTTTDNFLIDSLSLFKQANVRPILLPSYVYAATLHLSLLRDSIIYGKEWGYSQELIECNYARLRVGIANYSDYCATTYHEGLNNLRGSTSSQWIKFNSYRTNLTINALDLVMLFPFYDPRLYPEKVNAELTREIYTDPVGHTGWDRNFTSYFNTLEATGTRGPGLVTNLSHNIDIFSDALITYTGATPVNYLSGWGGTRHYERYTGSSDILQRISGTTSNDVHDFNSISHTFRIKSDARVAVIDAGPGVGPGIRRYRVSRAEFHGTSRFIDVYNANSPVGQGLTTFESMLPGFRSQVPNPLDYSHELSNAACVRFDSDSSRINVYGWRHKSSQFRNEIQANRISQIPAVKGYYLSNSSTYSSHVIKGTNTGGDLIHFLKPREAYNGESAGGGIRLNIYNSTEGQSYRIRFRYAADKAAYFSVFLQKSGWNSNQFVELEKTYSGNYNDLKYNDFQFAVLSIITPPLPGGENQLYLDMVANSFQSDVNVILDKIEFIPSDVQLKKCTDCQYNPSAGVCECKCEKVQSLEKEIVNSLFVK
ncbi:hypothetical protein AC241_29790 (plasmid) [Bacillus thuringiensis]|nr:insecticidal delta-endotoxin Cry8Ea1 family protein [Bacillus thuringiensis]AKR12911.1 hypothetical protein AC241_29790 [Bacillus thuringiensis]